MFKANIEVTTIEEFKTLVDTKIVNVSNKVEEAKEVAVDPNSLCTVCGSKDLEEYPEATYPWFGTNSTEYEILNKSCKVCGFSFGTINK